MSSNFLGSNQVLKNEGVSKGLLIFICYLLLTLVGLLTLHSANYSYYLTHIKHITLGLVVLIIIGRIIPLRVIQSLCYSSHFILLVCLCLVLILGYSAGGAQRWLDLRFFRFQPSEFIKITLALVLAQFFYNQKLKTYYLLTDLIPVLFNSCLVFVLIFMQPDFGTAGLCFAISLAQLSFINLRISKKVLWSLFLFSITLPAVGWLFFLKPYQKLRVLNLLNPELDPSGSGYNSIQSLVAVGSGGFWGKGFMQGSQTQLHFLPARHTDFIFSVFSEEFGFFSGVFVFSLFFTLFYLGLIVARESNDSFKKLAAIGLVSFVFLEFFINIAMVLGLFPVVGMPLPFFSYGGSSVLTISVATGILIAIDRDNRNEKKDILING